MIGLTTELLSRACRIFLTLAYPEGEQSIPEKKRAYLHISDDAPLASLLPPAPAAVGLGEILKHTDGTRYGYALRLGSSGFAHMKLQVTEHQAAGLCVFAVNTHDSFPHFGTSPPEAHPDFAAWSALQKSNRQLKERIERAWEQEGLWTFHRLLRLDLDSPGPLKPEQG
ncbi:MAG: hypothetical protein L0Z62_15220 [Gemmataceae bacterium]|nr:hypothetical protein [Gemmataceae bacterium]